MPGPEDAMDRDEDPYDRAELRAALDAADLDWTLEAAEPVAEASDTVYVLTVADRAGDRRRAVLKAADFVETDRFLNEPDLLRYVGEHTAIPVPEVLAVIEEHERAPAPSFLLEHLPGTNPDTLDGDLGARECAIGPGELERMARQAGDHLAQLHGLDRPSSFGFLSVEDGDLTADRDAESWPEQVEAMIETPLEELSDGRFADLEPDLRAELEAAIPELPDLDPVPTHSDYRPGNLLVDPGTGEITAVLDWGAAAGNPDEYELALVEQYLSGWAPIDDDRRRLVRSALLEGYRERRTLDRPEGVARRRDLYLLVTRLFAMHWLPYWHEDVTPEERDRIAAEHRAFVRELLDR